MYKYSACRPFVMAVLGVGLLSIAGSALAGTESRQPSDINQYRFHLYPDLSMAADSESDLSEMLEQAPTAAGPEQSAQQKLQQEIEDSGRYHNYPAYQSDQPAGDYPSIGPVWTPTQERGFRPSSQ